MSDYAWRQARLDLPTGSTVIGVVTQRLSFGVVVRLTGFPEVTAVVEIANYRPDGQPVRPADLPPEGSALTAVVVNFTEHNQQVRLRVGDIAAGITKHSTRNT